jgi:hypothetical protein
MARHRATGLSPPREDVVNVDIPMQASQDVSDTMTGILPVTNRSVIDSVFRAARNMLRRR